jgi:Na+/melibiose symporter-like transporter
MVILAIVQIIGVVLELTSNLTASWGQFTAGRFLAYISTGLAEMAVIHFNGEVSPASTRGLLAGTMLFFNALGNLWGAGMSRAFATETANKGWLIPTAVQFIPAVLILIFIWFTVESPRWLIVKGKKEAALASLNRLRPKEDVANGLTKIEVDAIVQSLEEQGGHDQGRWIELLQGNMLRRTWICCTLFALLQSTGIQWTNSFAATYYVNAGLRANSFTYVVIGNALQIVSCAFQIGTYDWLGRRFFSIVGGTLTFIFLTVIATLGTGGSAAASVQNTTAVHSVIASIILTATFARWSVTNAFVIGKWSPSKMPRELAQAV